MKINKPKFHIGDIVNFRGRKYKVFGMDDRGGWHYDLMVDFSAPEHEITMKKRPVEGKEG